MITNLGTHTLAVLTAEGRTTIEQTDHTLLDAVAQAAEITPSPNAHLRILDALDRDSRFRKQIRHTQIESEPQSRRIRAFVRCDADPGPDTITVQLPADPWLLRRFVGTLLCIDPMDVTPAHTAAIAPLLSQAFAEVAPKARERIVRTYGLDGQPPQHAEAAGENRITVRSSIAMSMLRLGRRVREQLGSITPDEPELPGDPLMWERVDRSGGETACWPWTGTLDNGYPVFKRDGKKRPVAKYVYELFYGPVPLNHYARPTCDISQCVNPGHLDALTVLESMAVAEARKQKGGAE